MAFDKTKHIAGSRRRVIIIGGGFAGLNLAKHLDKRLFEPIIIDRNNYNSFPPLFYQVASGGLDPGSVSFPFRSEMRKRSMKGCTFHLGEVLEIDPVNKTVRTKYETVAYDELVIAAGTTNNFYNNPSLEKYVFTMKSTTESIRLRNEILDRLERASVSKDAEYRSRLLSFVVIGGGPTGVEIAGALGEMKRYVLPREYPGIKPDELKIVLIEGSDRLLRTMSQESSRAAVRDLGNLMVDIRLSTMLKGYDNNILTLSDDTTLYSSTVIWTAGVKAVDIPFKGVIPEKGPGNRIITDEFQRVKGLDNVYALGDIGYCSTPEYPHGWPQLAQPAIQQGRNLAENLNSGKFSSPFKYKDKGSMATIGRNKAVVDSGHLHLNGFIAWGAWMLVHLLSLLGMRNKAVVMVNWIWSYFTYATTLRLLLYPDRYPLRTRWGEH